MPCHAEIMPRKVISNSISLSGLASRHYAIIVISCIAIILCIPRKQTLFQNSLFLMDWKTCTVWGFAMLLLPLHIVVLLATASATPLDDYVNAPDPTYEYLDLEDTWKSNGCTSYILNLTSQMWLTREFHNLFESS